MPTRKLTASFIKNATSEGKKREYFWDASKPGFGLMVTANGARSYVVQYRNADGVSRRMTIDGRRPLVAAKKEAEKLLGKVAHGDDPLGDKRREKEVLAGTLRKAVEEYLDDYDVKQQRSIDEKRRIFERYIFPMLGSRPVTEIERPEIVRMLGKVKTKNGPAAADNAFKVLNAFFNWYAPRQKEFRNPIVKGVHTKTKGDGSRTLTDDEVRILWSVAGEGRNAYDFVPAIHAAHRHAPKRTGEHDPHRDLTRWHGMDYSRGAIQRRGR